MPSNWVSLNLGRVCEKVGSGATPRGGKDVYLPTGPYSLIRSQNVLNDGFCHEGLAFIGEAHASQLANVEVLDNDVLLNITGDSVARVCQVDPSVLPGRVNQHVAIVRPDSEALDARFLRYVLASPRMQAKLLSLAGSGGTRNALTKGMIESLEIQVPAEVSTQRVIAGVIGALDDKIELNRRMDHTLAATAQALFKSWFVDFEPVRAKAESRARGRYPRHIADLFPDRITETEAGSLPSGWQVGSLNDIAESLRRTADPTAMPATPYIGLEHMPRRSIALTRWGDTSDLKSNKWAFHKGEILFGKLRPYFHKVGIAPVSGVCSTDIVVIAPKAACWSAYLLATVSSAAFVAYTNQVSTGTKMPRASWESMSRYSLPIPPTRVVDTFERLVKPFLDRIVVNVHESHSLAQIRDALLPRLVSGAMSVRDAEDTVQAAL